MALPDARSSVQQYLDEVAPASVVGRLIKFSKDGAFIMQDDGQAIPEKDEFISLAGQTMIGWVKFGEAGEPPDRVMGLLYHGFVMPARETLGDLDPTQWEEGLDGQPADPWQHHQYLVLQNTRTSELSTFVTSSKTGRRAVGNLLRHYDRMRKSHPNELPVIRLSTGGFQHRDDRVGWVKTPTFIVVGHAPRDSAATPDTSVAANLDDEIPY